MFLSILSLTEGNNYSFFEIIYIFFISFLSNTFSAISGGGAGLIQLPALIVFGIPYYQALATHKIATVALGIGGSVRNYKTIRKDIRLFWLILLFGIPGVVFGASIVEFVPEEYLYLLLGLFSILLAIYLLFNNELGLFSKEIKPDLIVKIRFAFLIYLIGILNGSFSSGTGLLVTLILIRTFGIDFLRAVRITLLSVGIFWNATGAFFLSKVGIIPISLLLILTIGSFLGGFSGSHLANLKGNKLIKRTFIFVCLLVGISLLIKFVNVYK